MGNYVFYRSYFKWDWHEGDQENLKTCDIEMDYPEGPKHDNIEIRARMLALAIKDKMNLELLSTTDNFFTFDVSENIIIHPSTWYKCNVNDNNGIRKIIYVKLSGIRHFGKDLDCV